MVIGHFRPAILIPIGLLAGLPMAQVEAYRCTNWRTSGGATTW